ncbi:MAG: DUF2892 domain-containing protein [Thiogranum sp.]|nr:DUF2892 domain-containing protein [Thiogranum sp.]
MSERIFRLILGVSLLVMLYFNFRAGIYAYIALLLFEGITNWRVPILVSRARFGSNYDTSQILSSGCAQAGFDAERALRLIVAVLLVGSYVMFREQVWFFPWFIGSMLLLAGITNICPMVMALRWIGFR